MGSSSWTLRIGADTASVGGDPASVRIRFDIRSRMFFIFFVLFLVYVRGETAGHSHYSLPGQPIEASGICHHMAVSRDIPLRKARLHRVFSLRYQMPTRKGGSSAYPYTFKGLRDGVFSC